MILQKYRESGRQIRRISSTRLIVPKVIENRYVLRLRRILQAVHREYERHIGLSRSDGLHEDSYHRLTEKLDQFGITIQIAIKKPVEEAFDDMAHGVQKANKRALAKLGPTDMRLGAEIQKFRDKNIQLIENAGRDYAQQVREIIEDPENFNKPVSDLASLIKERSDVSESRAELIARDQTLKLNGQINQTRQENAGVEKYTWSTSHDERVRDSHRELDGEVFSWSSPPEPGHPGQDFQCRCIAIPVFEESVSLV